MLVSFFVFLKYIVSDILSSIIHEKDGPNMCNQIEFIIQEMLSSFFFGLAARSNRFDYKFSTIEINILINQFPVQTFDISVSF